MGACILSIGIDVITIYAFLNQLEWLEGSHPICYGIALSTLEWLRIMVVWSGIPDDTNMDIRVEF